MSPRRVRRLHDVLVEEYRQGHNVVLVVDEAQNMPIETLENLRMLSNLETSTDKLIQIVLVGQPEFDRILDRHELRQLKQRIAVRSTLAPLSAAESLAYIRYRLEKAGAESTDIFTRGALRRIVRHARGIPRLLNILCDNALITGLGYQKKPVTAAIVREVIADFEGKRRSTLWKWEVAALAALLVVGGLFFMAPLMYQAPSGPERAPLPASLPAAGHGAGAATTPSPNPPATANPPDAQASPAGPVRRRRHRHPWRPRRARARGGKARRPAEQDRGRHAGGEARRQPVPADRRRVRRLQQEGPGRDRAEQPQDQEHRPAPGRDADPVSGDTSDGRNRIRNSRLSKFEHVRRRR